jgi:hypothetical protein
MPANEVVEQMLYAKHIEVRCGEGEGQNVEELDTAIVSPDYLRDLCF